MVLAETEDVWGALFQQSNLQYTEPRLVLFTGATSSACGFAQSAMGPFYCPNDQTVYLDIDFFRVMEQQLGSRGEFARAYVIAHEVGHHVQDELGLLAQVNAQRGRGRPAAVERAVGAGRAAGRLLRRHLGQRGAGPAAADRRGHPRARSTPPRGSATTRCSARARAGWCPTASPTAASEQRQTWFHRGFQTGDPDQCDTFSARRTLMARSSTCAPSASSATAPRPRAPRATPPRRGRAPARAEAERLRRPRPSAAPRALDAHRRDEPEA